MGIMRLDLRAPNTPGPRPDVVFAHYTPTSTRFASFVDATEQLPMVWPNCDFRAEVGAWYVTIGGDDVARLVEEN